MTSPLPPAPRSLRSNKQRRPRRLPSFPNGEDTPEAEPAPRTSRPARAAPAGISTLYGKAGEPAPRLVAAADAGVTRAVVRRAAARMPPSPSMPRARRVSRPFPHCEAAQPGSRLSAALPARALRVVLVIVALVALYSCAQPSRADPNKRDTEIENDIRTLAAPIWRVAGLEPEGSASNRQRPPDQLVCRRRPGDLHQQRSDRAGRPPTN